MNIETLAMKKNRKQTKENAQHTNSNKGSSARKRAKTHVRRQSTDNRPSLKATGAQEKGSSVQPLKPVSIDREVAREIQKSKNIGVLLRQRGKAIKRLGTDYREALRREAGKLYAAAQLAACNKDLWRSLCEDRVWAKYGLRPTVADQYNALWFVMLHAFGPTRAGRQKASKFHCALKLFFAEGVPADDLPSKIKDAKGIEALARANAKRDENTPPTQEKAGGGETPPAQPAASQPSNGGDYRRERLV
jgi:hypothetical protein